jgi:uncharacterized membrane protein
MYYPPVSNDAREYQPDAITATLERPPASPAQQLPGGAGDALRWVHRGLTLAAVMGLVVNTRSFWNAYALTKPWLALVLSGAYLVMLIAAILTLCASTSRTLRHVDIGVLTTAIVIKAAASWTGITGVKKLNVDEGMLMDQASRTLAAGHNPYLAHWTHIDPSLPTQLMDGRTVFDFGYPPFGIEMGALVHRLAPSLTAIVAVAWMALFATAIFLFRVAPAPLRPVVTLGVLGLGTMTAYADNAYPSMIALPFLCVAVWKWPSTGRSGALGWAGIVRAVALGLACSIHQLGWFLAVFLLVGLLLLRLGDLPGRAAWGVVFRYAAVAAATFLLTSVPFIVASPGAWLTGVLEPMLQHAVPHGQGIITLSYYVTGGSGALDWYGRASIVLFVTLLALYTLHFRTLGRAAVVLPWLLFWVSTRSQDGYWVLTMPLWVAGLVATRREDFANAYELRLPAFARSRAAMIALFVPALACVGIAAVTPQPLTMQVGAAPARNAPVTSLNVQVTNNSGAAVEPHFAVTTGVDITEFWKVAAGPELIPAGESATYTLTPREKWKMPAAGPVILRAVSDRPQTLSSLRLAE